MTVEPMTDEDPNMIDLRRFLAEHVGRQGSFRLDVAEGAALIARIDAERARADAAEAERDAAVARAMPGWRYLATWDAVNTVEARHNDEPAPGLYAIWKPGWPYPSAASVQFGVFATDEESPAPDDYLLGAWISGPLPLPDLPTPTAGATP